MMKSQLIKCFFLLVALISSAQALAATLPPGFVYLKNVDPSIIQEMRYAGYHNFVGRPIKGYRKTASCIVTKPTAAALKLVQADLKKQGLSLKVYDCYRPQMAVNDFMRWSQQPQEQSMKAEFYPRVNKKDVFKLGYVAAKSGHTRGSTVDITIVPLPVPEQASYHRGQPLVACYAPRSQRFEDNSIDMGAGYDCFDEISHVDYRGVSSLVQYNRQRLRLAMMKHGFVPYPVELWHFTLKDEPFPSRYFNFEVA